MILKRSFSIYHWLSLRSNDIRMNRRKKMSTNPINLVFRFILEMAALAGMAYWGWSQNAGLARFAWAIGLPLAAAILWGTFAVPADPSRSGKAPVPVPGAVRLLLELVVFGAGAWAWYAAGITWLGTGMALAVVLHYVLSYDRVIWLLGGKVPD